MIPLRLFGVKLGNRILLLRFDTDILGNDLVRTYGPLNMATRAVQEIKMQEKHYHAPKAFAYFRNDP